MTLLSAIRGLRYLAADARDAVRRAADCGLGGTESRGRDPLWWDDCPKCGKYELDCVCPPVVRTRPSGTRPRIRDEAEGGCGLGKLPGGCICFVTDEKYWFRYGSTVEPGSQMEPNPFCPVHFPVTSDSERLDRIIALLDAICNTLTSSAVAPRILAADEERPDVGIPPASGHPNLTADELAKAANAVRGYANYAHVGPGVGLFFDLARKLETASKAMGSTK